MNDADVRARLAVEVDRNAAVAAGAGSGKTTVLIARLVGLLGAGVNPTRIAAITFTEAAAGEISVRLRDRVEAGRADNARLDAAAAQLGELQVSTLHAFCQRLLEAEALAARIAPGAAIGTGGSATERAYRAWRSGLRERQPLTARLVARTSQERDVRAFFHRLRQLRALHIVRAQPLDVDALRKRLDFVVDALLHAAARCTDPRDKLHSNGAEGRAAWDGLRRQANGEQVLRDGLRNTIKIGMAGGAARNWPDGIEHYKDRVADLKAWQAEVGQALHGTLVEDLVTHGLPSVLEARAQAGERDFEDLLIDARDLLARDEAARRRLGDRFDALLVDEVQDTDPLQAEVALLLTRDPAATGPWTAHPPRPGRLFAVGDAKQAIYGFRDADVGTWRRLSDVIAKDGVEASLTTCFRSVPPLVDFVNAAFSALPDYEALHAHRTDGSELDPVVAVYADKGQEHQAVVDVVADLTTRQGVRRSDILVLLPSWTAAPALRAAFAQAAIPIVTEGANAFFARDEISLAIAGLAAVDEPADGEAVVFTLRGLFGFTVEALARHVAAGGSWRFTAPEQPEGPVRDALAVLAKLHRQRARRRMTATLDALLEASHAAEAWALRPDGRSRLANVDHLRDLLRAAEADAEPGAGRTHAEVVAALRARAWGARQDDAEQELALRDPGYDAVRITTVYRAKGREARVAIVHAAHRKVMWTHSVTAPALGRAWVRVNGDLAPPGWKEAEDDRKHAVKAEWRRLIYVAATRARDQLIVVAGDWANDLLTDIRPHLPPGEHGSVQGGVRILHAAQLDAAPAVDRTPPAAGVAPTEDFGAHLAVVRRAARDGSTRRVSVTEAVHEDVGGTGEGIGRVGGIAVHEVMCRLDLGREVADDAVRRRVAEAATRHRLAEDDAKRVLEVVRGMLAHPVLLAARAAPFLLVETPFCYRDARGRLVNGVIDLCFPDADGTRWTVVDWKSDLPAEGTPQRAGYERQVVAYGRALLATAGATAFEPVLVGPHLGLRAPVPPTDVDVDDEGEERPYIEPDAAPAETDDA